METNIFDFFFVKWSDKGKVAYSVSKLKNKGTVKSNILISFIS